MFSTLTRALALTAFSAAALTVQPVALAAGDVNTIEPPTAEDLAKTVVVVDHDDAAKDVAPKSYVNKRFTAAERAATDLKKATYRVDRVNQTFKAVFTVRELRKGLPPQDFEAILFGPPLDENDVHEIVDVHISRGSTNPTVWKLSQDGDGPATNKCGKGTGGTQWAKNRVWVKVPISCLFKGQAFKVKGMVSLSHPKAQTNENIIFDYAALTRTLPFSPYED